MRLAFGMMPAPFRRMSHSAALADRSGFDTLWVGDMQSTHPELYVTLAAVASNTQQLKIGPGVTNPMTRDPAVTAGAVATLSEMSGGRVFLGIGAGDSALHNIGLHPARLQALEDYVLALRSLWQTGSAAYQGRELRLMWWKDAHHIPIYVAAHGPKALEMAGRIADGVIVGTGFTPEAVARSRSCIERGAAASGRSLADLTLWYLSMVNVHPDPRTALTQIATTLAALGNLLIRNGPEGKDIPADLVPRFEELERRYDFREHASAAVLGANAALVQELDLLDYLAERFAVAGDGAGCAARIASLQQAGVDNLWFTRSLADTDDFLERWASDVTPRLGRGVTAAKNEIN